MTSTLIRGTEVTRPDITALTSSVLDHATVVENTQHFGLRNNEGLWPSYNCLDLLIPTDICPDPATNEVQTLTVTGDPTGGTFGLVFNDGVSGDSRPIPWNATASEVQDQMNLLANISPGDVTVTGGPLPDEPLIFTFAGRFAGRNVAPMTVWQNNLTGGSSPSAAVTSADADEATVKTFDTAPWVPAFQFAVQGGVQCKAVGLDKADMEAEVARVFGLSEGKGVERALLGERFVANGDVWDAPTDLTPVSAVPLSVALALLEGEAARVYAGVPTIHMPRAAASLLGSDKIVWKGDKAYTRLGSKVAIGGGYDVDNPTGLWDMYATGEVYVEKSESVSIASIVMPGDGSNARGFEDNTVLALAERMFRVAVDCFVVKATGTVWA